MNHDIITHLLISHLIFLPATEGSEGVDQERWLPPWLISQWMVYWSHHHFTWPSHDWVSLAAPWVAMCKFNVKVLIEHTITKNLDLVS